MGLRQSVINEGLGHSLPRRSALAYLYLRLKVRYRYSSSSIQELFVMLMLAQVNQMVVMASRVLLNANHYLMLHVWKGNP